MAVKILTAAHSGIEGNIITVEADISSGLPCFNIVGLADMSVKESKERVRSAIINSGYEFPVKRITVNLAPADLKKEGSLFDLPIAIGILAATKQIPYQISKDYLFFGELSLSGELNGIRGALPIVIEGFRNNIKKYIVPYDNVKECSAIKKAGIYAFNNLKEVCNSLCNSDLRPYNESGDTPAIQNEYDSDFSDVIGQDSCKRAVEVSAAGGHNLIMFGPPGCGKTMIAKRIPSILPDLSFDEALEVTKIYSVSGNLSRNQGLMIKRPFRNPHHTSSKISLVGGGSNLMPGEISLSHNGILFLDELLEFKKGVIEVLRQPLEDKEIKISRASGNIVYPANFMLIASLNPCPCGYYGSSLKECTCTEYERKRYLSKLSGPLLDRIDIFSYVCPVNYKDIKKNKKGESSESIRKRVNIAREIQKERFKNNKIYCNAQMDQKLINIFCALDNKGNSFLEKLYSTYKLSSRAYSRILKVARTIADLHMREKIKESDLIEALAYRRFIDSSIV